jgi:fluoride exporter
VPTRDALAVAAGGAAGAGLRWAIVEVGPGGRFPWAILAANLVGSLLLGYLVASAYRRPLRWSLALGVGFCGGLTTFSSFAVSTAQLSAASEPGLAAAYALATVGGCLVAAWAGIHLRRT